MSDPNPVAPGSGQPSRTHLGTVETAIPERIKTYR